MYMKQSQRTTGRQILVSLLLLLCSLDIIFGDRCHSVNGSCNECNSGYFGPDCESNCSENCFNNECDKVTGNCASCQDGYFGPNCSGRCHNVIGSCDECNSGYFGPGCESNCSENCFNNECDKVTGNCASCQDGYFGPNCSRQCSNACLHSKCHVNTGSCFQCEPGRFGVRRCYPSECEGFTLVCTLRCHHGCLNHLCNQTSGACFSCASEYEGLACSFVEAESLNPVWMTIFILPLLVTCILATWFFLRKRNVSEKEIDSKQTSSHPEDGSASSRQLTIPKVIISIAPESLSDTSIAAE